MITITFWEWILSLLVALGLGLVAWDIFWTVIKDDARAADHFKKANSKTVFAWLGYVALALVALIGWLY